MLKKFDLNPSTEDSFKVRTLAGAFISVITVSIMAVLFWGELKLYMHNERVEDMVIDKETTAQTDISLSVDFPFIPCDFLQVGYRDALGNDRSDIDNEIFKTSLDVNGNLIGSRDKSSITITVPTKEEVLKTTKHDDTKAADTPCGDCFGAGEEGECCNDCQTLLRAYQRKHWNVDQIKQTAPQCKGYSFIEKWKNGVEKGCRVEGHLHVSKVQGHMFIIPSHANDLLTAGELRQVATSLNVTHTIHWFSLGTPIQGQVSPFEERRGVMTTDTASMYQYFVNAIPTTYIDGRGNVTNTYQVTETHHIRPLQSGSSLMPGLYFVYEFSPLRSVIRETHLPFFELCTSLCAILGGVFTMMGMVDSVLYSMSKEVKRKSKSGESELTQRVVSKSD